MVYNKICSELVSSGAELLAAYAKKAKAPMGAFEKKLLGTAKLHPGSPVTDIYTKGSQVVPLCTPKNPMPAELRTFASWAKCLERQ